MAAEHQPTFRELLRRFRGRAGLTQEALAERAGISTRGLSDLERGINEAPRADTLQLLIAALGLEERDAVVLEAAARAHQPGRPPIAVETHAVLGHVSFPAPLTPMIGREVELATIERLLREPETRLVSLTGPGGVGKTRLSLAVGATLAPDPFDTVIFCDLAPVSDPGTVGAAIAHALEVPDPSGRPLLECLADHLDGQHTLIVLDNFEHLIAASPLVAEILIACPTLKVLVTTRTVLRVRGEHEMPVRPLHVPDFTQSLSLGDVQDSPAVSLFAQRARAARPDWQLSDLNARAVTEICRRLDGLPLAIELAAARSRFLSPQALLARLDRRLQVLIDGARDLPPRQQTLRDTIGWSYDLLDAKQQRLFRSLAIFSGGARLEAVTSVHMPEPGEDTDVFEALAALVENSVVQQVECFDGDFRFRMLQTIREYGLERLADASELEGCRRRHAIFYRDLALRAEPHLKGAEQPLWLRRLDDELDNLRAAMHWCVEAGETDIGLTLAGALWRYWYVRISPMEGYRWLDTVLGQAEPYFEIVDKAVLARALLGAGALGFHAGIGARTRDYADHALALYRELGDNAGISGAMNSLANIAHESDHDLTRAEAMHRECLSIARLIDDKRGIAISLQNLAHVMKAQGDQAEAEALFRETLAMRHEVPDLGVVAGTLSCQAQMAEDAGNFEVADTLYAESATLCEQFGHPHGVAAALTARGKIALALHDLQRAAAFLEESVALQRALPMHMRFDDTLRLLGHVARDRGDVALAGRLYRESLALARRRGKVCGTAASLEAIAALAGGRGQHERAARLFSAASTLRQAEASAPPALPVDSHEPEIAAIREALGEERFAVVWASGRMLTLQQAIDAAVDEAA